MKACSVGLFVSVVAVPLACSDTGTLRPASSAASVAGQPEAAKASQDGIEIVARSGWTGDLQLESQLTPLRVTIQNDSGQPLQIDYDDFELRDGQDVRYRALHFQEIDGTISAERRGGQVLPRESRRFTISPGFASIEQRETFYDDDFEHDGFTTHSTSIYDAQLPTKSMYDAALPEGELADGGMVEGYLYFEPLDETVDEVRLFVTLPEREGGPLEVPFVVQRRDGQDD